MFSVLKFIYFVIKSFPALLNIKTNGLATIPDQTKWLAMVLLSCFWCLAFGLYIGELLTIGYNMIGHIAIVTMAFVTWWVFRTYRLNAPGRKDIDYLRMPDRSSRCDEYTDEKRHELSKRL